VRKGLLILLLWGAASEAAAPSPEALVLEPSSPWRVDFGEGTCTLFRQFSAGNGNANVQLQRSGPLSEFVLAVNLPATSKMPDRKKRLEAQFGGDNGWIAANVWPTSQAQGRLNLQGQFPMELWDRLHRRFIDNTATVLKLRMDGQQFSFNLQRMKALKAALDKCDEGLMAEIGLEGIDLSNVLSRPEPTMPVWSWTTRWEQSVHQDVTYMISARAIIDDTGKIEKCINLEPEISSGRAFEIACELLMQNGRFKPARAASGAPVKSYYDIAIARMLTDEEKRTAKRLNLKS